MTEPNTSSSPGRAGRRSEFIDFYDATYPVVTGELLAFTGSADLAHAAAGSSYARAWQAWPSLRTAEWPAMWVRVDAVRRVGRPVRAQRLLERGLPPVEPVLLDPEDEVLVAGLQLLPAEQRLPLVLHYMAQLPVDTVVEWFGGTADQVEADLDDGFEALVGILDWPDDAVPGEDDTDGDDPYGWTAEALEDSAQRLAQSIATPPPTLVFRRATVKKVTRRGAPATAAAAAACIGLVVYFSPAPAPEAAAAAFSGPPPTTAQAPDPLEAEAPAPAPVQADPAPPASRSAQRPVTTRRSTATSKIAPSLAAAAGSAAESTIATTTGGTTTAPTTTSPAGATTSTTTSTTSTTPTTTSSTRSGTGGASGTSSSSLPSTTDTVDTTPTSTSETETETSDPETTDPETDETETSGTTHTTTVTETSTETETVTAPADGTDEPTETETETSDETETSGPETDETEPETTELVVTPPDGATAGSGTSTAYGRQVAVGRVSGTSVPGAEVLVGSTSRHDGGR